MCLQMHAQQKDFWEKGEEHQRGIFVKCFTFMKNKKLIEKYMYVLIRP